MRCQDHPTNKLIGISYLKIKTNTQEMKMMKKLALDYNNKSVKKEDKIMFQIDLILTNALLIYNWRPLKETISLWRTHQAREATNRMCGANTLVVAPVSSTKRYKHLNRTTSKILWSPTGLETPMWSDNWITKLYFLIFLILIQVIHCKFKK